MKDLWSTARAGDSITVVDRVYSLACNDGQSWLSSRRASTFVKGYFRESARETSVAFTANDWTVVIQSPTKWARHDLHNRVRNYISMQANIQTTVIFC